jgi:hypothetical protein
MNILSPVGPVLITLDPSSWGQTIILPVSIQAGYVGKVCLFKFDVTLQTDNPADMGGYSGLEKADYTPLLYVNTLSGLCSSGSWHFEQDGLITPDFYEAGLNLRIAIGDTNYQECVVTHSGFKLISKGKIQYLPIMGVG